ncbi:hypothetical protein TNIN_110661 [Trichonephila inaurata madagascariensis]|uniref:Uncharacterized protein n=1 Tax=Trichonephila inaurata madagascariensis TaxID=2747483 RepID=A0A8X6WQZ0_9ARAC|nr:hypothetical protein TNIN_110661 [Trichonephila inaurata madagascariensis]
MSPHTYVVTLVQCDFESGCTDMLNADPPQMYEIVKDYAEEAEFHRPGTSHDPDFETANLNDPLQTKSSRIG